MNILYIVSGINSFGGIESFCKNVVPLIDMDKYHIDFLITQNEPIGEMDRIYSDLGCKIYRLDSSGGVFKRVKKKKQLFKSLTDKYDIVHIHTVFTTAYYFAKLAHKYAKAKVIVHSHIASDYSFKSKIINNLARRNLCKFADLAMGCSANSAVFLFGRKVGGQATIINNGINLREFEFNQSVREKMRREMHISEDCFIMGTIGRMSPQKNLLYLIDIFYAFRTLNTNVKLLLVGDGACRESLENRVNELKISDDVIFTGARKDVVNMLNLMDCFVLPSFFEGLAISAVEAQANGLVCFISDTVTKDIDISKRNVFLNINRDAAEWACAIQNTDCERVNNTELLSASGFSANQSVKRLLEVYDKLMQK